MAHIASHGGFRTTEQALAQLAALRERARQLPELGTAGVKAYHQQTEHFCAECSDDVCRSLVGNPEVPMAYRRVIAMRLQGVWAAPLSA
jgi:hypothetical protein